MKKIIAYLSGVLLCGGASHSQEPTSRPDSPSEQQQRAHVDARPRYTYELGQELRKQSCFDVPLGAKIGGLVPVGEVSQQEMSETMRDCERILRPEYLPRKSEKTAWCKELWSKVDWGPPRSRSKDPDPPVIDTITAKWSAAGLEITANRFLPSFDLGVGITLRLEGAERIPFRYPSLHELGPEPELIIESHVDKGKLLETLTKVFRIPWESTKDFVIIWSPSASALSAGRMEMQSTRRRRESEPLHWMEWFDELALHAEGTDPQYLTIRQRLPSP